MPRLADSPIPLAQRAHQLLCMLKRLEKRESYRAAHEFIMVAHNVSDVFRHVRPASAWRLGAASMQIMHFVIHSDRSLRRKPGQWRIGRAIAAAAAAGAALRRMRKVEEHRVIVGAALEVLERLTNALQMEQIPQ